MGEEELFAIARVRRPRVKRWWGVRGGGEQKHAECYVCDRWIDTWAARWPMPKHARIAIDEHKDAHLAAVRTRSDDVL